MNDDAAVGCVESSLLGGAFVNKSLLQYLDDFRLAGEATIYQEIGSPTFPIFSVVLDQ